MKKEAKLSLIYHQISNTHLNSSSENSHYSRVATVREKSLENKKNFQVREKSGNFNFSQGILEKVGSQGKVREFENFQKSSKLKGF